MCYASTGSVGQHYGRQQDKKTFQILFSDGRHRCYHCGWGLVVRWIFRTGDGIRNNAEHAQAGWFGIDPKGLGPGAAGGGECVSHAGACRREGQTGQESGSAVRQYTAENAGGSAGQRVRICEPPGRLLQSRKA